MKNNTAKPIPAAYRYEQGGYAGIAKQAMPSIRPAFDNFTWEIEFASNEVACGTGHTLEQATKAMTACVDAYAGKKG